MVTAAAPPSRADHVSKRFARVVALDDVTLRAGRGEIFGLLGPNGVGRTTLIRTILDIIKRHGAERIFRASTLMYGKRPTLPE